MARTRQKKRVLTVTQPKEMEKVAEDEFGEKEDQELEKPSSPKQPRLIQPSERSQRQTRSTAKRTLSNVKFESALVIPKLVVTPENTRNTFNESEELEDTQPEIILTDCEKTSKTTPSSVFDKPGIDVEPPSDPPTPPCNTSTEEARHYMSPNDAQSCSTIYATLGPDSLTPNSKGCIDSPAQETQRASSSFFKSNLHDKSMLIPGDLTARSDLNFGPTFYFIEPPVDEEKPEMMEKAYYCLVNRCFTTSWISESEAIKLSDTNESVNYFVFSEFEGELFEKLRHHPRWQIYSPNALLHFFSEPLPERDHPILDVSMRSCFVTVSGFPRELRKGLEDKMRFMSARISSSLKDRTTHVIASTWNTEKCMYSRVHGHPLVMHPHWIDYCWENLHQEEVIDAYEISHERAFRLPVFAGFVICGSNLPPRGRERLCELVEQNGGIYETSIDVYQRTTHVVMIKKEGALYEKVMEYERIKIVSPDWIHESIARGYPLPEEDLSVKKIMNKLVFKMMNLVGASCSLSDSRINGVERSSILRDSDIRIPASPEFDDNLNECNDADDESSV